MSRFLTNSGNYDKYSMDSRGFFDVKNLLKNSMRYATIQLSYKRTQL